MMNEITMPEPPQGFPLAISPDEIPYRTACDAYAWNSQTPERRARQEQAGYLEGVFSVWNRFAPLATDAGNLAKLTAHLEQFRERYRRWTLILLAARSRVANPMVTGPANFPVARNRKRLETEDRRREEFLAWHARAVAAIARDMAPPPPSDAERLSELESQRDRMKAINAEYRKCRGNIDAMTIPSEKLKATMKAAKANYWAGGPEKYVPFEGFELTSINGKIKRIAQSAAREAQRNRVIESLANTEPAEVIAGDVRILDNVSADRVQVIFPGKPDAAMRDKLKSSGFRWSPTTGAWQAYRTSNTCWRIRTIFGVEIILSR